MGTITFLNAAKQAALSKKVRPWSKSPSLYSQIQRIADFNNPPALADETHYNQQLRKHQTFPLTFKRRNYAAKIGKHLYKIAKKDSNKRKIKLFRLLRKPTASQFIEAAIHWLHQKDICDEHQHLQRFARFLLRRSPDRGPIKLALMLLGEYGHTTDITNILHIGQHAEFALYAFNALELLLAREALSIDTQLIEQSQGWIRFYLLQQALQTPSDTLSTWLLQGGYQCDVQSRSILFSSAEYCHLETLLQNQSNPLLLQRIAAMLQPLLTEQDQYHFQQLYHADRACFYWLRQARQRSHSCNPEIAQFNQALKRFLQQTPPKHWSPLLLQQSLLCLQQDFPLLHPQSHLQ